MLIKEKDKEIKLQGLKLKDLLYADEAQKEHILRHDFEIISKLAHPHSHKKGVPNVTDDNMKMLEKQRDLEHKYGKRNPLDIRSNRK